MTENFPAGIFKDVQEQAGFLSLGHRLMTEVWQSLDADDRARYVRDVLPHGKANYSRIVNDIGQPPRLGLETRIWKTLYGFQNTDLFTKRPTKESTVRQITARYETDAATAVDFVTNSMVFDLVITGIPEEQRTWERFRDQVIADRDTASATLRSALPPALAAAVDRNLRNIDTARRYWNVIMFDDVEAE